MEFARKEVESPVEVLVVAFLDRVDQTQESTRLHHAQGFFENPHPYVGWELVMEEDGVHGVETVLPEVERGRVALDEVDPMMISENQLQQMPDSKVACVRCDQPMKDAGELRLHEGGRFLAYDLNVRLVEFQVYICPNCGKVEFFL